MQACLSIQHPLYYFAFISAATDSIFVLELKDKSLIKISKQAFTLNHFRMHMSV